MSLLGWISRPAVAAANQQWLALITDPKRGRYRTKTPHRAEIERCMNGVIREVGKDRPFTSIERGDIRLLWRRERARRDGDSADGARSREIVEERVC